MPSQPHDPPTTPAAAAPLRPRKRWLGRLLALLLVLGLAGSAWWLVQRAKAPAAPAARGGPGGGPGGGGPGATGGGASATVGVARARQGELPIVISALGTVTPVTQVLLRPQVSGVLTEVLFTEGQVVNKGQLLARIDPRPFEQALAQAQGERARIQAQLAAARVTLGRYETLWKQDSIARQDVDTQAALVKQLEGQVQSSTASEGNARINLDFARITAPIAGRIGLRAVDPGNMVQAGATTGIATITQMAPIDVKFAVPQDRVPEVIGAQRASAGAAGPSQVGASPLGGQRTTRSGEAWGSTTLPVQALDRTRDDVLATGRFLTLDNVIDTATGTLQAKARFDNAKSELFPNQFVNVRLRLGATPGVLVPVTAVRTGPNGDYVYVVDAERVAHMRAVKRGGATVDEVLVSAGVQAGEMVVTEGGDRVKDGGKVALAGERPAGGARGPRGGASGAARAGSAPVAAASEPKRPPVAAASAPIAADSGASAPARAASAAWMERLPPEVREKVMAMPPEERRAFIQQLRERKAAREAQGQ